MFVNTEQVQLGVVNFIENEIAKKATGVNKFTFYFITPIVSKKVGQYLNSFSKNELTKDMFDEQGNVDLDMIYNMAKQAVTKSGQFVLYGIIFNETDVDKLYNYIKQTSISAV